MTAYSALWVKEIPSRSTRFSPAILISSTAVRSSGRSRFTSSIYIMFPSARPRRPGSKRRSPLLTAYSRSMLPKSMSSVTFRGRFSSFLFPDRVAAPRTSTDLAVPVTPLTRRPPALGFTRAMRMARFACSCPTTAAKGYELK